jgi:hypothetical protein
MSLHLCYAAFYKSHSDFVIRGWCPRAQWLDPELKWKPGRSHFSAVLATGGVLLYWAWFKLSRPVFCFAPAGIKAKCETVLLAAMS